MKEDMLRNIASSSQFTMQELRTINTPRSQQTFRMDVHDDTSGFFENADLEIETLLRERELEKRKS